MKTIPLSKEYEEHNRKFSVVKLRNPRLSEFLEIGEISSLQPTSAGMMVVEHSDAIVEYAPRLVQEPGYECLERLELEDQIALKEGIKDLFIEARKRFSALTSSSSVLEKTREPSEQ